MRERRPIFYDEHLLRWRRTRRTLKLGGLAFTFLLTVFFVGIIKKPDLPSLLLPSVRNYHAIQRKPGPKPVRPGRRKRVAALGKVPGKYDPLRAAFYVSWDANSLASLQDHYKNIDLLIPEQLHAVSSDGSLSVVDYYTARVLTVPPAEALRVLQIDKLHVWLKTILEKERPPMMGLVNNYDGTEWRVKELVQFLDSTAAREKLTKQLVEFAIDANQPGVVVDFEEVPDSSQKHFRQFAAELGAALHAAGKKMMIALPARDQSYDYVFFAAQSDAIIVMNYDQHWLTSKSGPIAAQDWFEQNLKELLRVIPPSKVVMGIANYAYDWSEAPRSAPHENAENLTVQEALLRAYESETDIDFDSDSLNPHYSYSDEHNHTHSVWMLDAVTAYNQLRATERAGVQGTALWRLGSADASIWPVWDSTHLDEATRAKLSDVPPGPDLIFEGKGDIWKITDTPKRGQRSINYDAASDYIIDENYDVYPLSYRIDQFGAAPKKMALTFDDGPDPDWTPKVLDILKQKHALATFFVIGEQASNFPGLLKRIYASGHELGNHTFYHPPFNTASRTQVRFELNVTERLFESMLGIKTSLFRPPYGIDQQPESADDVKMLPIPQQMGYILVGAGIDPHDWGEINGARPPTAPEIIREVLRQAPQGNIILLHDGGGNRSNTVEALPGLIDSLRANGYEIVLVSDLLGKTRAEVMTPIGPGEQFSARVDGFVFAIYHFFRLSIAYMFVLGIALVSGRALIIGLLALIEKMRPNVPHLTGTSPPVTVLIPAYDEEDVIVETVQSALDSDYANLYVVVVNDGSVDRTEQVLDENFSANPRVKIIHQPNRGKPGALARALAEARGEIVVTIDADTAVEPDAITKLIRHFTDPKLGAVAGNIKVGNRSKWLTRWQALEYITSQNLEKRAFDLLNCITVVPGALGAWRVEALRSSGGFSTDTVAEDADLTIAIRRAGWRVGYDEEAIAWTQAPETASMLVRQRFRWTFGTLQAVWKHRDTLFRWKYGTLGFVALPNVFIFQILLPLISPVMDLLFVTSLLLWGLAQLRIARVPQLWTAQDVERSVIFFAGFMLIDLLTCVVAFLLEKNEDWSLLWPLLLQRFYYRQMMYVVLFRSVMGAVQGHAVGWRGVEPRLPTPVSSA